MVTHNQGKRSIARQSLSTLISERDSQTNLVETHRSDVYRLQLAFKDIAVKLRDKSASESRIVEWKADITQLVDTLKVIMDWEECVVNALKQSSVGPG